jgi:uncharacterized protein involved in exopolysaccharide biosynthesis
MKSLLQRSFAVVLLAVVVALVAAGAAARSAPTPEPDKLVLLATTDVKGKTMPCG